MSLLKILRPSNEALIRQHLHKVVMVLQESFNCGLRNYQSIAQVINLMLQ